MKVLDILSWLPAQEISLEELEQIFMDYKNGVKNDLYIVLTEIPSNAMENVLECKNDLVKEGKKVACILREEKIVALIGYRE